MSKKKIIPLLILALQTFILYSSYINNKLYIDNSAKVAFTISIFIIFITFIYLMKPNIFINLYQNELLNRTWKQFKKNTGGKSGLVIICILIYVSVMAPYISPYSPTTIDFSNMSYSSPSLQHWFGTDDFGRDLFSRIIYGTRIALGVAFAAVFLNAILGITLGLIAGYYGGKIDTIIMRIIEIWNSIPFILLALAIIAALGKGIINVIIAVGVTGLINFARITRSAVLTIKEKEYVTAARALGSNDFRIIYKHILPNSLSSLIVISTLRIGQAILMVASLSFLGLGVQPPMPSWGTMLKRGQEFLIQAPWISMFAGFAIIITVLSFNLLGDALRDALDPKQLN